MPLLTVACPLQSVHSSPSPLSRSFGNTWARRLRKSGFCLHEVGLKIILPPAPPYPSAPNESDLPKTSSELPELFLLLPSCWTARPSSCGRQFAGPSEQETISISKSNWSCHWNMKFDVGSLFWVDQKPGQWRLQVQHEGRMPLDEFVFRCQSCQTGPSQNPHP